MPHPTPRIVGRKRRIAAAFALVFVWVVCFGTILAASAGLADSRPPSALETAAGPEDAQLTLLFEQGMGDPAAPASESAEEVVRQATKQQVAALFDRGEESLELSREISRRVDTELALLTSELGGRARSLAPGRARRQAKRAALLAAADERRAGSSGRIESGSLALPQLTSSEDGTLLGRHRFERPFDQPPRVALGMRESAFAHEDRPRVALRVVQVDETGFDYELRSWGSSRATGLTADWVALANLPARDPVPSKMR